MANRKTVVAVCAVGAVALGVSEHKAYTERANQRSCSACGDGCAVWCVEIRVKK